MPSRHCLPSTAPSPFGFCIQMHWQEHVVSAVFAAGLATWFALVAKEVPVPYLDEFFHVPQAQKYCAGDYTWDPKITTPPGLYLVAKLFSPLFGCSTTALRAQNVYALCFILTRLFKIRKAISLPGYVQREKEDTLDKLDGNAPNAQTDAIEDAQTPFSAALTAFNIASFPPLYFFGALYYTDVMSTAAVLMSYEVFLASATKQRRTFSDDVLAIVSGIVALFFRQTNIFWVAVFPAGLTVVRVLGKNGRMKNLAVNDGYLAILKDSWSRSVIYDCSLQDSGLAISDSILFVLTTAIAALSSPLKTVRSVVAYVFLLVLFAGFVAWNGSVVLGDKSAHTATIHTPQMLYIWPYIALFSAPIFLGPLYRCIANLLPSSISGKTETRQESRSSIYPQPVQAAVFISAGLLAVHFNTIIHPYTLADNRHYVFYVFRLLLRHPVLKYLAVPVYYACFCLSIQSLAHPTTNPETPPPTVHSKPQRTSTTPTQSPVQISFVIIWLITTSLSVVTAPLVEPRYFIIPWIIWRLHVPHAPTTFTIKGRTYSPDLRVVVEAVWLFAINQTLQYLFLNRTFTWPSEPGNKQRFLW